MTPADLPAVMPFTLGQEVGPHRPGDVRGLLVFEWLPDELQNLEDATVYADYVRAQGHWGRTFTRPATDTEKVLLTLLGYDVPAELVTRVSNPSGGLRTRHWPAIEENPS